MRRVLALVSALALVMTMGSVASAGPAYKTEVHSTSLWCDGLTGAQGTVFLGLSISDDGTADAYFDLWAGEPFEGPADLTRNYDEPVSGSVTGGTLSATIPLMTADGSPAGSANVSATLEPAGEPFGLEPFRVGNRWIKTTGTEQPLLVTGGTLAMIGGSYTLDSLSCWGIRTDAEVFETNPNAFVANFSSQGSACIIDDGSGATAYVELFVEGSDLWAWTWVELVGGGGFSAEGSSTLVGGAATIPLTVYDPQTGEPSGSGSLDVAMTRNGEGYRYTDNGYGGRVRGSVELLDIEGSLSFSSGEWFSLDSCVGYESDRKHIFTNSQGPRPGGRAPGNDLPAKAAAIKPGGHASASTRGAAVQAEVPYECLVWVDEDGTMYDDSAQHTVWYKLNGTGGTVTLDTSGSDFDTVLAVYTKDAAGNYLPVSDACLDDTWFDPIGNTRQTILSFAAASDTTYYVQAGGYPGSSNWGNLKLAIR